MTEAATVIICQACQAKVPRGKPFCNHCGALLSRAQLRASATRRWHPEEFVDLIKAHLQRLAEAEVPLSVEAIRLHNESKPLLEKLKTLRPDDALDGVTLARVMTWFSAAGAELVRTNGA